MDTKQNKELLALLMPIGKRIQEARLEMRLSVQEAATRAQVVNETWRRVEMGYSQTKLGKLAYRPSAKTVMAIARVVRLDGAAICKEIGLKPPPKTEEPVTFDGVRTSLLTIQQMVSEVMIQLEELRR